jgi:dihydropteroate synthase
MSPHAPVARDLVLRGHVLRPGETGLMAIVNRTPDSFFDHGAYVDDDVALAAVARAVAEGADAVDVGGVRAGPGPVVSAAEEQDRVVPFVSAVRERWPDLVISVDTWRAEVADAACAAGADLVNDAWGGSDPEIPAAAAQHGAAYVCAHTGGHPPRDDPHRVRYADLVGQVLADLEALAERAVRAGVREDGILIDAAQDFGKNTHHSLAVTAAVPRLVATGWPVLLAVSNKNFLAEAIALHGPKTERLTATLTATVVAAWEGARLVRAHDVPATRQALDMVSALRAATPREARRALG